jgi:hypothetical protein
MPGGTLVAVDHVGGEQQVVGREQVLSEMHTIRVVFHDFANLPNNRGVLTKSAVMICHGYQWKLLLFPGGSIKSNISTVHLSFGLQCVSAQSGDCEVKGKYAFRIPSANYSRNIWVNEQHIFSKDSFCFGYSNFLLRSDVLDLSNGFLVDGNLIIEVDIQVYRDESSLLIFRPKTTLPLDMIKFLESANQSGEVKLQVGPEEFSALRGILEARAPELAALAKDYPSDTLIHIQGIKPSTFRSFLRFVYADVVPNSEDFQKEARELLDVADRFGCKGLKLLAEAELVESGITVDTAADMLILADAKNCAMLKEAAIAFYASKPTEVMSSSGWAKLRESADLLTELLEVLASNKKSSAPANVDESVCKRMRVSTLRTKLEERGLDVDGSREMLIRRLEEGENDDGYGIASSNVDNVTS